MSYPYDSPSLSMSTCWISGSYKPADITRTIRDNYTPVNKNSMTNSVGQEIALMQNYVNSKYLGRPELPVQSGFITDIDTKSGFFSGYVQVSETRGNSVKAELNHSGLVLSNYASSSALYNTQFPTTLNLSGLKLEIVEGTATPQQTHKLRFLPNELYMYSAWAGMNYIDANLTAIPNSGITIEHVLPSNHATRPLDSEFIDIKPSGIYSRYGSIVDNSLSNIVGIELNPSGRSINIDTSGITLTYGSSKLSRIKYENFDSHNQTREQYAISSIPLTNRLFLVQCNALVNASDGTENRIPANTYLGASGFYITKTDGSIDSYVVSSGDYYFAATLAKNTSAEYWQLNVTKGSGLWSKTLEALFIEME